MGGRPCLNDDATVEDLPVEEEVDFIQSLLTTFLDAHVKKITICAQSKRW